MNTTGNNSISSRKNCTGSCCVNPYVLRTYCNNSSICTDNITTMKYVENINLSSDSSYRDIDHTVSPNHKNWINGFRHFSNKTTQIDGDNFSQIDYKVIRDFITEDMLLEYFVLNPKAIEVPIYPNPMIVICLIFILVYCLSTEDVIPTFFKFIMVKNFLV